MRLASSGKPIIEAQCHDFRRLECRLVEAGAQVEAGLVQYQRDFGVLSCEWYRPMGPALTIMLDLP